MLIQDRYQQIALDLSNLVRYHNFRFIYQWLITPHTQNGVRITVKHVHNYILFSYPIINTDFGQKYQIRHYCPYITTLGLVYISTFYSNSKYCALCIKAIYIRVSYHTGLVSTTIFISGPLGGYLIQRFSCRSISMVGSLIMSAGIVGTGLVPTLNLTYLTFGATGRN